MERGTPLAGRVAVVTGASRGAGRGIAQELGAAGATVYVSGRRARGAPRLRGTSGCSSSRGAMPCGTIDDTADEVTRFGGRGVAVRCDHTREDEVASLFARVVEESGWIDVLVNNAWGGHESVDGVFQCPFWEHPLQHRDSMIDRGVRNHPLSARAAAPSWRGRARASS